MVGQASYSSETKSLVSHRGIRQIIVLFCALEILDAIITYWAIRGGLVAEGNPFIVHMAGDWSYILLKFVGAVLSGLILEVLYEHFPKVSMVAAASIAVFYGAVLAWNSGIIIHILLSL
jgi:hypothetical protein